MTVTLPPTLSRSAVVKLRTSASIMQLVTEGTIGYDTTYPNGWIARRIQDNPGSYFKVEDSGKAGIILSTRSPWAIPNLHNTARFPRLRVDIIADVTRDSHKRIISEDAEDRCEYVFSVVDKILHNPGNNDHAWPLNLYVQSCLRSQELEIFSYEENDHAVIGTAFYNIELV